MPEESAQDPRAFIQEHLDRGDATGWFDHVYTNASGNGDVVPWATLEPRPAFAEWANHVDLQGQGKRALVIACGLGDDAEELAKRGFDVTAFDISPTAIAWCKERFPNTSVDYLVADLFTPPAGWVEAYDFVLEIFTIQALPIEMRAQTIEAVADLVAPGGEVFLFALGSDLPEGRSGPPWPLTKAELAHFEGTKLVVQHYEELRNPNDAPNLCFRVVYRREQ